MTGDTSHWPTERASLAKAKRELRHLWRLQRNLQATERRNATLRGILGFVATLATLAKLAIAKSITAKLALALVAAVFAAFPVVVAWLVSAIVVVALIGAVISILTGGNFDVPGMDVLPDDGICKSLKRRRFERMIAEREAIINGPGPLT